MGTRKLQANRAGASNLYDKKENILLNCGDSGLEKQYLIIYLISSEKLARTGQNSVKLF